MVTALALLVWILLGVIGVVGTTWLVVRAVRRGRELSWVAKLVVVVAVVAAVAGAIGTGVGFVNGFGAVGGESVEPSRKARILAEGISEAMNCTAFGLLIWVPSFTIALVLTRSRRKDSP